MGGTAGVTLQGSQFHYFRHDVMRFFAESVLCRAYEPLTDPAARRHEGPFCFDPASRAILRPSDVLTPLALRDFPTRAMEARVLAASLIRRPKGPPLTPVFHIHGLRACGMVVHARDNTLVVVQRRPRRVWKLVQDASHGEILDHERTAARLAPSLVPAVREWQPPGETIPGYVALEYALDTEPVSRADLPAALRAITPALMDLYRAAGVSPVEAHDVDDRVRDCQVWLASVAPSPFTAAAAAVLLDIRRAMARHAGARRPVLHRTFAHGDIQASNLRRSGRRISLIDWGNAGAHNVLLDAFIVELFAPTPEVWSEVLAKGAVTDVSRGFSGWLPAYLAGLERATGIRLSPSDIAIGLICSMAEKAVAIVSRHAGTDETRGLHSLGRVQRLLAAAT